MNLGVSDDNKTHLQRHQTTSSKDSDSENSFPFPSGTFLYHRAQRLQTELRALCRKLDESTVP